MRQVQPSRRLIGRGARIGRARRRRALLALGALGSPLLLGGCQETDSFLFDQSFVGRWEYTPATTPILTRISSIEGPADEYVEIEDVQPQDLIPEIGAYRVGAGDSVLVTLYDLPREGEQAQYERILDSRGIIELPQIGEVRLNGLTVEQAKAAIAQAVEDAGLLADAIVDLLVRDQRQQRFSMFGAVGGAGQFFIPEPDYRLLDAITAAGGMAEAGEYLYVIRPIPLSAEAGGESPRATPPDRGGTAPQPNPENLINLIEDLSKPKPPPGGGGGGGGSPGVLASGTGQPPGEPPIGLVEPGASPERAQPEAPAAPGPDTTWVFLNGEWVMVKRAGGPAGAPEAGEALATGQPPEDLVTQRVIRIPIEALVAGDARYNIVIRPGDVVRVPPAPSGTVFIMGKIARSGAYNLSDRLTLKRLIASAGGLGPDAIPERVDLTRMLGNDREATIRLNVRAIFEATQPDFYLKANDQIVVGTNFWALPLAVIRGGFRYSYGFGFIADRNFANDIYGVQDVNQIGQ